MNLCEDGHEELCYKDGYCPACEVLKEKSDLEYLIGELQIQIEELKNELQQAKLDNKERS